jgi:hypothetical protein
MHADDATPIPLPLPAPSDHLPGNLELLPESTANCGPIPAQGSGFYGSLPEGPAVQVAFEVCEDCNWEQEDIDDHEQGNDNGDEGWQDIYEFDDADELRTGDCMKGVHADPDGIESDIADASTAVTRCTRCGRPATSHVW